MIKTQAQLNNLLTFTSGRFHNLQPSATTLYGINWLKLSAGKCLYIGAIDIIMRLDRTNLVFVSWDKRFAIDLEIRYIREITPSGKSCSINYDGFVFCLILP